MVLGVMQQKNIRLYQHEDHHCVQAHHIYTMGITFTSVLFTSVLFYVWNSKIQSTANKLFYFSCDLIVVLGNCPLFELSMAFKEDDGHNL